MSKVFVISDTWFNRPLDDKPDVDVVDYNEFLIHNWNEVVGKNDDVYVLGGFGVSDLYNIVFQLSGKIHFLNNVYNDDEREAISLMKENVERSIVPGLKDRILFNDNQIMVIKNLDIILSYLPLYNWIGKESGTFCFHGFDEIIDMTNHSISCSAHKWNGVPVNIKDVSNNILTYEENV